MTSAPNRVAVVTGANRGIGLEVARELARAGLTVVLTCRDEERGREAKRQLAAEGINVDVCALDVTKSSSIRDLALYLRKHYGRLDILVNNAGIMLDKFEDGEPVMSILDCDLDNVRTTMETNVYGALSMIKELLPLMKENHYGRIVNVSSGLGQMSEMGAGYAGYRLSKAALNALTCMVADEVTSENIIVNACCPGWVRTDMGGRHASRSVEEGADTIVWLCQAADGFASGKLFRDREEQPW
ncbi:MAG: SDR family oxidoreductase [Candidatus Obscuribacterales bacterium]|nr:SDR family oxidoreductase [Candidatus Obscuribacterales bacterium]